MQPSLIKSLILIVLLQFQCAFSSNNAWDVVDMSFNTNNNEISVGFYTRYWFLPLGVFAGIGFDGRGVNIHPIKIEEMNLPARRISVVSIPIHIGVRTFQYKNLSHWFQLSYNIWQEFDEVSYDRYHLMSNHSIEMDHNEGDNVITEGIQSWRAYPNIKNSLVLDFGIFRIGAFWDLSHYGFNFDESPNNYISYSNSFGVEIGFMLGNRMLDFSGKQYNGSPINNIINKLKDNHEKRKVCNDYNNYTIDLIKYFQEQLSYADNIETYDLTISDAKNSFMDPPNGCKAKYSELDSLNKFSTLRETLLEKYCTDYDEEISNWTDDSKQKLLQTRNVKSFKDTQNNLHDDFPEAKYDCDIEIIDPEKSSEVIAHYKSLYQKECIQVNEQLNDFILKNRDEWNTVSNFNRAQELYEEINSFSKEIMVLPKCNYTPFEMVQTKFKNRLDSLEFENDYFISNQLYAQYANQNNPDSIKSISNNIKTLLDKHQNNSKAIALLELSNSTKNNQLKQIITSALQDLSKQSQDNKRILEIKNIDHTIDSIVNLLDTLPTQAMNDLVESIKTRYDLFINEGTWSHSIKDACTMDQSIELAKKIENENWDTKFKSLLNLGESETFTLELEGDSPISIETEGFTEMYLRQIDDKNNPVKIDFENFTKTFSIYCNQIGTSSTFYIEGCKTINSSYIVCKPLYSGNISIGYIMLGGGKAAPFCQVKDISKINSAIYCK